MIENTYDPDHRPQQYCQVLRGSTLDYVLYPELFV